MSFLFKNKTKQNKKQKQSEHQKIKMKVLQIQKDLTKLEQWTKAIKRKFQF